MVNPLPPYNIWNGVDIQEVSRSFRSVNWDAPQGNGQSYFNHQCSCGTAGGGRSKDGTCSWHGRGGGRYILETDTDKYDFGRGGCGRIGRYV